MVFTGSILNEMSKQAAPRRALTPVTLPDSRLETEYQAPYTTWKEAPTPTNTGALVRAVKPVIDKGIRSYGGGDKNNSPIIRGKAKQIVMDSFEKYDPQKAKLQTHLLEQLKGLQRYKGQQQNIISMPERVVLDRQQLDESTKELEDWLGREPSDKELADKTGLSLKRIKYIRQAQNPLAEGTYTGWKEQSENAPLLPPVEQQDNDAWVNFVYHHLADVKNSSLPVVMEYTLGLHGKPKLSTAQLAQKLGVSPGRVAQYRAQIQEKLDQQHDLEMRF